MLANLPHFPLLLVLAAGCAIIQASSATVNNPLQQRQLTEFPLKSTQRFCEGGHRCTVPKECCHLGCCYPPYAPPNPPKTPSSPVTDHVLNLFLVNHWYFWCVILAIVLVLLCICTLWNKRRQLCSWNSSNGHHSEGDSAGSCYLPPQYSRCSSFHHAPPPYTEVTSKPDLYPLVFSCNGTNDGGNGNGGGVNNNSGNGFGKNGTGYLMVHYFRNYIVRPVGSLSATSTVDSLSSSYICTVNEANTIVPPPYSRAASPGLAASADRLESANNQQQGAQELTSDDFNQVSRSQSMQQDRVGEDVQYCLTNNNHVNNASNHMSHLHHQKPPQQQNQHQLDGHLMITGRSLSAPLADDHMELSTLLDERGEERDREYHRRRTTSGEGFVAASATRDWGNGCYANVDCSTGCGRERYHNEQMQRRSAGAVFAAGSASLVNVDVVVETSIGSSRQPEMKTTNNNKNNNCHSNESGYHNMMMLAAMNSGSPSLEHGAVNHSGGGSSSHSIGDGNCHGSGNNNSSSCCNILDGSTVCYSRSEYELRKLRSSLKATADRGAMAKSIEERSVPWHNGPLHAGVERGRSLEDTESGLLMGYYRQQQQSSGSQLDKQQTLENYYPALIGTKLDPQQLRPNGAVRPNSYHYTFNHNGHYAASGNDENDSELIEGGNSQMDRLTEELNDLFSGVERALSGVRVHEKRKSSADVFDAQHGKYDESFNALGIAACPEAGEDSGMSVKSPTDIASLGYIEKDEGEGVAISFSDLRLDLAARARLMQRQMSVDQDQSFLSSLSRRDYMDSPLHHKSSLIGSGNPFENLVYMNSSNTGSAVSSLVNMDCTPSSPPQATSPTDEMRELLEQINQLQRSEGEDLEDPNGKNRSICDEEERIIQRLRSDSDRERNGEDVAVDSSIVRDWHININVNSISTATDNNEAMTTTSDTRNTNNKSTKRPLSFQNNRCHFSGNLNLPVRGVNADEANAEESDLNLHSTAHKKIGSHLNSHLKGITNNSGRNSTQFRSGEQEEVTEEDDEVDKCFGSNYKSRGGVINNNGSGGRGVSKKPNKSFYIPVATHSPTPTASSMEARSPLEGYGRPASRKTVGNPSSSRIGMAFSPTGGFPGMMFLGQGRKFGRLSRSAPSTPGTALPTNKFDDISPLLLDEHEEEDHS